MHRRSMAIGAILGLTAAGMIPVLATTAAAAGGTRQVPSAGSTTIRSLPFGTGEVQQPELRPAAEEQDEGGAPPGGGGGGDPFPNKPLKPPVVESSTVAGSNPEVALSFNAMNHRDQRLANEGNQFSLEPPDQGLCVGNGYVVEAINSVLQVWNTAGAAQTGVQDLNTFFGYPAAINRTTGVIGPDVIDPICHYDPENQRFVVALTTLDVNDDGDFNGKNTIDVAVSNTANPTGSWTIYHVPAQNDGTDGTPNHHCKDDTGAPGPCFQDYPHIGADANGIYITTNEYDLRAAGFNGAQIFAFSKKQLAAHPSSIAVTLVENLRVAGTKGFTVWPATSPAGQYSSDAKGSEFFLSTIAGDGSETGNPTGTAKKIGLWALTNTSSLNTSSPGLGIDSRLVASAAYVFPPKSNQKPGDIPLGECINDTTISTPFGPGCWQLFFFPEDEPAHDEVLSHLDSNDTRVQQTWYSNGILWGTTDTAVNVGGQIKAGILWFALQPHVTPKGKVQGDVDAQGYVALAKNNLTYPAIAVGTNGKGVIAVTVVGEDHYPSAGYVTIDIDHHVGPIHIAAAGLGPADGFTSYKAFVADPPRTRWGDYGAAVTDGANLWIASEQIAQTCTLPEYLSGAIGSCGGTRTALGNWGTRITKLNT